MTQGYPTGLVTLVFTDLEGSSELSERHGAAFEAVRQEHFALLRAAAAPHGGYEIETAGDALFLAFAEAAPAVRFALDAQAAMLAHFWPSDIGALRVRIGLHTGEPFIHLDAGRPTYRGPVTNRAARIQAAAHGGQILLSALTRELASAGLPPRATLLDCGIHRLKGVGEEHLWQVSQVGLPHEFPPLNTLNPERHNLPTPYTTLIGREAEISAWRASLGQPTTRLLTLVAMGGMGKSRIALQLGELCVQDFEDGVWWVALEEARTGESMMARIAQSLRLDAQAHLPLKAQVVNYLRGRRALLILDNTEQIADAPAVVNELLQAAPQVTWCVTTRHALGLRAEQVQEVLPLNNEDATRFFVGRARSRKPDFAVTPYNAADVAEVCRRLEGVPLALELAASCITTLAPRELLRQFEQRFRILKTKSPDLPPRQRALRGMIDWSYELLTEEAKTLLARLAIFARGFTLLDADAVCAEAEDEAEPLDVWEGVEELRGQSLLAGEVDPETQATRFLMLESVRAYALEKLNTNPATQRAMQQRHATYFLQFAQERLTQLRTPDEVEALHELDVQVENLRAAFEWACGAGQYQLCGELSLVLGTFWQRRSLTKESLRCFEQGLAAMQHIAAESPSLIANLWYERGGSYHNWLDIERMRESAREALTRFDQLGDDKGQGEALNLLGLAAKREGDYDEARRYFALALRHHQKINAAVLAAVAHNNLGITECEDAAGDKEAGTRHLDEALKMRREHGDQRGIAESLNNLGVLHWELAEFGLAKQYYLEALTVEKTLRNSAEVGRVLYNLSEIAEKREEWVLAYRLATAADVLFEQRGSPFRRYATDLCARITSKLEDTAVADKRHQLKERSLEEVIDWALGDG